MVQPTISIIIPCYNNERTICQAIESAVKCDEHSKEIIVIDDASTDKSWSKIKKLVRDYPDLICCYKHNKNQGPGAARNTGIMNSNGKYLAFLDADDVYLKNRFSKSIELLTSNMSFDGVVANVETRIMDQKEQKKWLKSRFVWPNYGEVFPNHMLRVAMLEKKSLWHANGVLLRKSIFDLVGYFNQSIIVGEDREMWMKMLLLADIASLATEEPVAIVQRRTGSTWNKSPINDLIRDVHANMVLLKWIHGEQRIQKERIQIMRTIVEHSSCELMVRLREAKLKRELIELGFMAIRATPGLSLNKNFLANLIYGLLSR